MIEKAPPQANFQITAELPDGAIEPLLWVEQYKPQFAHPFLLRTPLELPKGSVIHGIPEGARVILQAPAPTATASK